MSSRNTDTSSHDFLPAGVALMKVESNAFTDGGSIPSRFTCDGDDVSPPLEITGIPNSARTLVLIMDDPDSPSGTWDHWVLFNIPGQSESLQSIPAGESPAGVSAKNSWGKTGYGGPCPGSGSHRYFFRVYALDAAIVLPMDEGDSRDAVERAMRGHVVAYGELTGRYERAKRP